MSKLSSQGRICAFCFEVPANTAHSAICPYLSLGQEVPISDGPGTGIALPAGGGRVMTRHIFAAAFGALLVVLPVRQALRADAALYTVEDLGQLDGFAPTVTGMN